MTQCFPSTTDWSCYPGYPDASPFVDLDPAIKARSELLAWMTLSTLTGQISGQCPITIRPCAVGCGNPGTWFIAPVVGGEMAGLYNQFSRATFNPHINTAGVWVNSCGCGSGDDCSCTALSEVVLPGPIANIEEVWVDGVELPATAYRVDNFNRLVRIDGEAWPLCQDMNTNAKTDEGSFWVVMTQGFPADDALNFAAGILAEQYVKACKGDKTCRLPSGVTTVVRAGVTLEINRDIFVSGTTGITEVDAVIMAYNPFGLRAAPVLTSPDTRKPRVTTWFGAP